MGTDSYYGTHEVLVNVQTRIGYPFSRINISSNREY